jgi:hypothetical protein
VSKDTVLEAGFVRVKPAGFRDIIKETFCNCQLVYCFIYRLVIVPKSTASKERWVSEVEGGCRDVIEELFP